MKLKPILLSAGICGLILIMIITILYASERVSFNLYTRVLLLGTFIWFAAVVLYRRLGRHRVGK